jgi:hypothetical protein
LLLQLGSPLLDFRKNEIEEGAKCADASETAQTFGKLPNEGHVYG